VLARREGVACRVARCCQGYYPHTCPPPTILTPTCPPPTILAPTCPPRTIIAPTYTHVPSTHNLCTCVPTHTRALHPQSLHTRAHSPTCPLAHVPTCRCLPTVAQANEAVAVARLGVPVRMLGRVKNDLFGRAVCLNLRESGINVEGVVVDDGFVPLTHMLTPCCCTEAHAVNPQTPVDAMLLHRGTCR
jgi:hypothetical protein